MAEERSSQFATVPHDFHYHYSEGLPKTPERELPGGHVGDRPPSARGFRVKRRSRPRINTSISSQTSEIMVGLQDTPLPSIEISDQHEIVSDPPLDIARQSERFLSPFQPRSMTVPRTPSAQRTAFAYDWTPSQNNELGQSIARPSSALSSLSSSSDDSLMSSEDGLSFGGSCTSPESDAPDPFTFSTPVKHNSIAPSFSEVVPMSSKPTSSAKPRWTKEMDTHIWAVYMGYLNDPTVTPFKTLPGIPPPVGVCHRVARNAKRTWKGGKTAPKPPSLFKIRQLRRDGSPDTVTERSGSATPTSHHAPKPIWPGSGAATRKRFRELCKRKATIAPHYQRMLQSRSPSPFFAQPQTGLRSTRAGSPLSTRDSFAVRDVAVSLSTSTATSMRPDAPIAGLSRRQSDEWFNDPDAPWASPAAIPSDADSGNVPTQNTAVSLGSPFTGSHTWGPSISRRRERPSIAEVHSEDTSSIPRLKSPVHFASVPRGAPPSAFAPRTPKRPAQNELEEELSGGESQSRRSRFEELFGGNLQSARRRLRLRGMSLEDSFSRNDVRGLSNGESYHESMSIGPSTTHTRPNSSPMTVADDPFLSAPSEGEAVRRLGSPFPGIGTRPARVRARHASSHSLSSCNPNELESIDQRLNQFATMGPF
ncbi:MAG: hypothetical protein LQ340_000957 [Diploschistes diacapsis]|nr:MAG: hypothetical protein LQ340_000957 [Diploschistes diacapsis]